MVRRLQSNEWTAIRDIRLRALRDSPAAFASSYEDEVGKPDSWWIDGADRLAWFVAEEGSTTIGVAAGMRVAERHEVISMWVDPLHRSGGTADALLAAVVDWARSDGAAGIWLAVAADNDRARHFYERAGFTATGAAKALRSRPEICTNEMRLDLV